MPTTTAKSETNNEQHTNNSDCENEEEEPKDMKNAHLIINELRTRCRNQSEQIMSWKKAYALQQEQNHRLQKEKAEQLNYLTSQLLLLESRIMRKQKQVSNVLYQRELTIYRQQKIIETLSSRLIDHGIIDVVLDPAIGLSNSGGGNNSNDFDSLNDSDSAVVLEDVDSDCNSSIYFGGGSLKGRCGAKMNNDVTIVRSISDAIETTNMKYNNTRRSNCFLRRPEVLETVYSVEEDPEPGASGGSGAGGSGSKESTAAVSEKRDKFKNRTEKCISSDNSDETAAGKENQSTTTTTKITSTTLTTVIITNTSCDGDETPPTNGSCGSSKAGAVTNFNRVMSNHRSVTKPKDVKYKRINKAKSKSLEELRGRLRHWVERGSCNMNLNLDGTLGHLDQCQLQLQQSQQNLAQSYA